MDYASINDELLAHLQRQYGADFNDFSVSQLAVVLVDAESYGADALAFYVDRRVLETTLATATQRRSVVRLTRQIGYKMRAAVAASVDVHCSVPDAYAFPIPIAKGFQIQGPGGLVFEAAQEVVFQPHETGGRATKILPCFEGRALSETFVSDGSAFQRFDLRRASSGTFVVRGTVQVTVDGQPWREHEMLTFDPIAQYEVSYADEPASISFGNGSAGLIPPAGATITVLYSACSGKNGRVTAAGTLTEPVVPLTVMLQSIPLTLTNPASSEAGDDPESIEEAKINAPLAWKTRGVAVTQGDYVAIGSSFADSVAGRVAVAQAFSTRSADQDLTLLAALRTIRTQAIAPVQPTVVAVSSLRAHLAAVLSGLTAVSAQISEILNRTAGIDTELTSILSSARSIEGAAGGLSATASSLQASVASVKSAVMALPVSAGAQNINQATRDALVVLLDGLTGSAGTIGSAAGQVTASAASQITSVGTARTADRAVGLDTTTPGTSLYALEQTRLAIEAQVGSVSPATAAYQDVLAIEAAVVTPSSNSYTVIDLACSQIFDHVDAFLASDCKANLVTVPVLARDAGGFYVAPSTTLLQALAAKLEACKELTQTIAVVSGAEFLVPAVISLRIGVLPGYSLSLLQSVGSTLVEGVLRGRRFRQSLYLSDFPRFRDLQGVAFANLTIDGHYDLSGALLTTLLDESGNLVIGDSQVITKGRITVTTEYAPRVP